MISQIYVKTQPIDCSQSQKHDIATQRLAMAPTVWVFFQY